MSCSDIKKRSLIVRSSASGWTFGLADGDCRRRADS
jgi:hypothetical protein